MICKVLLHQATKQQGPGLQSFLKVKVTITLREVILRYDNKHLIIIFRSSLVVNRLVDSLLVHLLNFS